MSDRLTFSFDGEPLSARRGQSLAAALTDAGQRVFRHTAKGSPRGIFCGMGVCQDCLLTVDGVPNQRACMSSVSSGLDVRTQDPRPALESLSLPASPGPAEVIAPDVLVVGAGAGGLNAAIVAAEAGARVLVVDERKVEGGQYFKQPAPGSPLLDTQQEQGADLLARARASGADLRGGVELWGVFPGPVLYARAEGGGPLILRPRQLIVATGAYERPRVVPGWTLPGVMTTGAAQTLWRSYRTLPGRRVAVCGSGPLNLQVALELHRGGADVRLVAESAPSPLRRPLAAAGLFFADPGLGLAGLGMLAALRRAGVPVRYRSELQAVDHALAGGLRLTLRCGEKTETLEVDALCMNEGFEPQNEILRLLGVRLSYDPAFGQLRCERTTAMETSVAGVFAVGDCCGLGGAPAAQAEGRIAGAAAARACGLPVPDDDLRARRALRRARRFQSQLWRLHDAAPRSLAQQPGNTLICRCEEVTLDQFRDALGQGSRDLGAAKLATRLGMGCCQGRYCAPIAARLVAEQTGRALDDQAFFAPRVPIKPVRIDVIQATQEAIDAGL